MTTPLSSPIRKLSLPPPLLSKESKGASGFPDRCKPLYLHSLQRIRKSGNRPIRKHFRIGAKSLSPIGMGCFSAPSRFQSSGLIFRIPDDPRDRVPRRMTS